MSILTNLLHTLKANNNKMHDFGNFEIIMLNKKKLKLQRL